MRLSLKLYISFPFLFSLLYLMGVFALGIMLGILLIVRAVPTQELSAGMFTGAWTLLTAFAIATLIVVALVKRFKHPLVIQILFTLALIQGAWITLSSLYPFPNSLWLLVLLFIFLWRFNAMWIFDLTLGIALAGIGALLGTSVSPYGAIVVLGLLGVYDYVAVYRTKHMVAMFKSLSERHVHFAFIAPATWGGLKTKMDQVSVEREFMFLGTGDIAIPLLFCVSALRLGLQPALYAAIGTLIGFICLFTRFATAHQRAPMAGLPPLVIGAVGGFLTALLIRGLP